MNTASSSGTGSLPSNTVANPKEEDERVEETFTDPEHAQVQSPSRSRCSINLMPLSVWKELGLPKLIPTQMTLELANRDICTPKGIARDVFVPGNSNPSSLLPPFYNSLSGSTTSSSPSLHISETSDYFLKEFADKLAHITFPPGNDDLPFDAESDLLELEYLLNHYPIKDMDSIFEVSGC
ncbi:hypothetical protein Tco_1530866 [Tanacetum coccineum]